MADLTHLTQEDEALRQARTLDLGNVLQQVADHLTTGGPGLLMTDADRLTAARTVAATVHPHSEHAAAQLSRTLLQHMPHITEQAITHGEYALRVRKTSWSV
ncbi:hypothetical protein ACFCWD_28960 [Streptomyces sp. NPDC056374]|uniref:hypothetical protein n=1 Tax=unclassified Streptomyces TaxID=2593676 RepID=UPI0035D9AD33